MHLPAIPALLSVPRRTLRAAFPWLAILTLGFALSGCMVGPNYKRPALKSPKTWLGASEAAPTSDTTAVDLARWWQAFNDPMLNSLVERGLRSNLDLELAVARLRQSRAVLGESASGLWPTLNFTGEYQRSHIRLPQSSGSRSSGGGTTGGVSGGSGGGAGTSTTTGGSGINRSSSTNLYRAGFDSVWEMDIFGGVRRGIEAARADYAASEENLRDVQVTLLSEIGTDYLNLRGQQEQLRITQDNLKTQLHSAEITRKRFGAGFASALDTSNAEAQVATTQAQIPTLEASIRQTIYRLSLLLGEEPAALVAELSPEKPLPPPPMMVPAGLPSDLLERRPDIRRTEAQLHAATARIGVAIADLFPKFTLNGSVNAQANKLDSWNKSVTSSWAFGPSVNWNIFSGGLLWYRVKENRALAEQALTQYRQTILTAFQEVENAWVAFSREIERARALEIAVDRNSKAVNLSNRLYIEGESDFLSVLVAERALFLTQDSLVQSRNTVATDLVALYKALGGGWEGAATPR